MLFRFFEGILPLSAMLSLSGFFFLSTVAVSQISAESGYVLTSSKYFMASTTELVCIDLVELQAEVTLQLIDAGNPHFPPLAVSQTDGAIRETTCLQLQVPPLDASDRISLRVIVEGEQYDGATFSETREKPISLMTSTIETFVQTDKPIYKAGQVVRIRILSLLYPSMRPYTEQYNEVYITTPEDIRVRQWRAVDTQEGLIDLTMQLSDDPVLGTWTIHTSVEDSTVVTQTFKIDEYVLPKFDVIITPPPFIFALDDAVEFSVCGVYTYGQPVRGSVQVNASIERITDLVELLVEDTGEDGCHAFILPLSRFTTDRLFQEKFLILDVIFTESATGISRTETHGTTKITKERLSLDILGPDGFKPGLKYQCKVLARLPSGLPAINEELEISVTKSEGTSIVHFEQSLTTDESGYVDIEFTSPSDPYITGLQMSVLYDYPDARISAVSATKDIAAWYSPSGSFLAIRPLAGSVSGILNAELDFIIPVADSEDIIEFTYNVFANRNLLSAGSHTWSPGFSNTEPVSRLLNMEGRGGRTTSAQSSRITQHTDPPRLQSYPDAIHAEASIPIDVTSHMAPEATVLVYFTRRDGEVVSAEQEFKVQLEFENDVSLEFNQGQVYPGSWVSLNIHAAPGSLCAIGSVDKSILLLEQSNRITKEKIFQPMSAFDLNISGHNSTCPQSTDRRSKRRVPSDRRFRPVPRSFPQRPPRVDSRSDTWADSKHLDALSSFKTTGAEVLSNFQLETRPCYDYTKITTYQSFDTVSYRRYDSPSRHGGARGVPGPPVMSFEPMMHDVFSMERPPVPDVKPSGPIYQLRNHFPETWLWHLSRVGEEGDTSVNHQVPHTITDWVTTGFCTSAEKGVGVADPISLKVFQPFFVSTTLPYSVVRDEEFPLKATVFNYFSECFTVTVSLVPDSHYSITDESFFQFLCICKNEAKSVDFNIIPRYLGKIHFTVVAEYQAPSDDVPPCGNSIIDDLVDVWDAVNRTVLVEAEGAEVERTKSLMICPDGTSALTKEMSFELPQQAIPETGSCKVQVTGNVLGPVLTNFGSLVRMPTGCGEQNMINFTPNIFVLMYLERTNQREALPGVYDKAKEYMLIGYERELHYRLTDGSYSAFGQRDGEGSTWLTAFVLKSFALASEFIDIDQNDLVVTKNWLIDPATMNSPDRCFIQRGRVIHKEMQGGHSSGVTLSAYVTIALLEAGELATSMVVFRATFCLVQALDEGIEDTYTLAMVTYALAKAGVPYYGIGLDKLNERAVNGDGTRHWLRSDTPLCEGSDSCKADPAEIEMTAYMLLTYLVASDNNPELLLEAGLIVEWLNEQRNSHGGFTSTQDTVIGLQALATYAERVYDADKSVEIDIATTEGNLQQEHCQVTAENDLLMREFNINQCPNNLRITAEGEGCVLFQLVSSFNLHVLRLTQPYFHIDVGVRDFTPAGDCSAVFLDISITHSDPTREFTNMAVVDIKMVSGYSVDTDAFHQYLVYLQQTGRDIGLRRYDTYQEGKPFALYFDEFGPNPISFTLVLKRDIHVKNSQDAYIKVFDYYEGGVVTYKSYHPCRSD